MAFLFWLFFTLLALIWGSFLNVVACRLITGMSIISPRSHCPYCKTTIAWYDNIPVLSWIFLRGKCRTCKHSVSLLYPFIEILTPVSLIVLYSYVPTYFFAYALFFSALLVTIRTDLEYMLICRIATIGIIPFAWMLSFLQLLPVSLSESLLGTAIGYFSLWLLAHLFYAVTKKHGLGEGDFDLLALIGAFCGIGGVFISILIGSWVGSVIGITYIIAAKKKKDVEVKLPFGPFLALGAMCYVIWHDVVHCFFTIF